MSKPISKRKLQSLVITCDYEWTDQYESVSESEARVWMSGHAKETGHDTFRMWEFFGAATVKVEETITIKKYAPK